VVEQAVVEGRAAGSGALRGQRDLPLNITWKFKIVVESEQ